MTDETKKYVPPDVWKPDDDLEGTNKFGKINRPTAGSRFEKELSVGEHPFQLYSLGTPNGQKVTILFEELLMAGVKEAEYDAWLIDISAGDQFGSGFVAINPNSKIPALVDYINKENPIRLFESGSIMLYLAEKFQGEHPFFPQNKRTEILNWLFWQMGSAPFVGGGFGHFYRYANEKYKYPIDRFTMETKRQLDVLNQQLKDNEYIAGDIYTIADMAIFPWYGRLGAVYDAATFLNIEEDYPHLQRWSRTVASRPAVQRGLIVNRSWGKIGQLPERHSAADIDKALAEEAEGEKETK